MIPSLRSPDFIPPPSVARLLVADIGPEHNRPEMPSQITDGRISIPVVNSAARAGYLAMTRIRLIKSI
jgi:hypothetical protein